MRLLIVDDDEDFTRTLLERLRESDVISEAVTARSLERGKQLIEDSEFDYIICDLKIPSTDGGLDSDSAHGINAYAYARERVAGTPVLVLSGFGDESIVAAMIRRAPHDDPFGTGRPRPMLEYLVKRPDLQECVSAVEIAAAEVGMLDAVNLSPIPEHLAVPTAQERVLRLFGRLRGGTVVRFKSLSGGLTNSKVLWVRVEDPHGALAGVAVAKIGGLADIGDECNRYDRYIVTLPAAFTPRQMVVRAGAGASGGIFYQLDEEFEYSLFDLLADKPSLGKTVVEQLKQATARWRDGRPTNMVTVHSIRAGLLSDAELKKRGVRALLTGLPWEDFEASRFQARQCPQHRDLHGLNVLVNGSGSPKMIDFGSAGEANAALDPVTLELSLLFHPSALGRWGPWPTKTDLASWHQRPLYLKDCPFPEYIDACRDWAIQVSGSNQEFYATAYGYAVRQLGYPDTDHAAAVGVIRSAMVGFKT